MTLYLLFVAGVDPSTRIVELYDTLVGYEGPVPAGATMVCAKVNAQYADSSGNLHDLEGCTPAEPGYRRLLIRIPGVDAVAYKFNLLSGSTRGWWPLRPPGFKKGWMYWVPTKTYCRLGEFGVIRQDFAGSLTRLLLTCGDTKCYWLVKGLLLHIESIDDGAVVTARLVVTPRGWSVEDGLAIMGVSRGTIGESRYGPLLGTAVLGYGSPGVALYLDIRVEGGNATGYVEVSMAGPFSIDLPEYLDGQDYEVKVYATGGAGEVVDLASDKIYLGFYREVCTDEIMTYDFDAYLYRP